VFLQNDGQLQVKMQSYVQSILKFQALLERLAWDDYQV
jgi:hypothetical protein